ncbi:MAG: hypothetical protein INF43_01970 [Alphaproteobacteria bacterium]|nr:hypothetical protein [Alphaproteobacteria bacterium]
MLRNKTWNSALAVGLGLAPWGYAQNYADLATISATLGVNNTRVCIGEGSRSDIGCPTYAPTVSAAGLLTATSLATGGLTVSGATSLSTVSATVGAFNSLTVNGLPVVGGASADRIVSGTDQVVVNGTTDTVSYSINGVTVGYFHPTLGWVGPGISASGGISGSTGYFGGRVGIGTASPGASLTVVGEAQVGSSGAACAAGNAGAIRYTGGALSFCNGSAWTALTSGNLSNYVLKAGDTMTGALMVNNGSAGRVGLEPGSVTNPGYMQFFTPDGTRRGYIGWQFATNRLGIIGENGWSYNFNITPEVNGSAVWHAGNFDPNGYVTKAGDNTITGNLTINNSAPTFTMQDTDGRSGYIHTNSNLMYFMGSGANNQPINNWTSFPMIVDLINSRVGINQICDTSFNNCRTPAQIAAAIGVSCNGTTVSFNGCTATTSPMPNGTTGTVTDPFSAACDALDYFGTINVSCSNGTVTVTGGSCSSAYGVPCGGGDGGGGDAN